MEQLRLQFLHAVLVELALGQIAGSDARASLMKAAQDDDPVVRSNVNRALRAEA